MKKALRPEVQLCIGDIVHEDRAFLADAIDVRRFADHQTAMVDAGLHPADVVAHDEEDVGLLRLLLLRAAGVLAGPDNASDISADAPSSAARQPARRLVLAVAGTPGDLWSVCSQT